MSNELPAFYSYPVNNDRRTKSLDGSRFRNSFTAGAKKRSLTMQAHVRETVLPAGALICSVGFVLAIVLFS